MSSSNIWRRRRRRRLPFPASLDSRPVFAQMSPTSPHAHTELLPAAGPTSCTLTHFCREPSDLSWDRLFPGDVPHQSLAKSSFTPHYTS